MYDRISGYRVMGSYLNAEGQRKLTSSCLVRCHEKNEAMQNFIARQTDFVQKTLKIVMCEYGEIAVCDLLI